MKQIGAFEAKNTLGALLDRVQRGEEIRITRHGKPVARLVPDRDPVNSTQARAAIERLQERAKTLSAQPFDWQDHKALRDADRP